MTNEQHIENLKKLKSFHNGSYGADIDRAIKSLEQEDSYDFARWVAEEIFDDMWEHNKDAFAEIACRKLAKLGIVRAKGDEWELIEPQESEDKE